MSTNPDILFTIDGREITTRPGTLVIEAARRQGIGIPSFCYYPGLALQAACRMCLVEVEKAPKLQTACTLVAANGMVVHTDTPKVHAARKNMLEFLLTNHPLDCPVCDKGGECELQDMTFRYGADRSRFVEEKLHTPEVKWSNLVYYDAPRCILCFRCVRVCDEGMGVKALGVGQRGAASVIIPNHDDHLECVECGMCIDICPVGALTSGTYRYKTRPWEMEYVPTVCAHCSNGCKTTLSVRNHEILRANNRDLSGYNNEFLCVKGRFGFDFTRHPQRLLQPLIRRNGQLAPASWEEALEHAGARLAAIRAEHGAAALGVVGSNRTTNEENYLLGRIARAALGINNIDHHRTADYAGMITALANPPEETADQSGAGSIFATMNDLASAPAFLLIGNDPSEQNPLVAWQIRAAIRHGGSRLYVINSRTNSLRGNARLWLEVAPGREAMAFEAMVSADMGSPSGVLSPAQIQEWREALGSESDLVILFGAGLQGNSFVFLSHLAQMRSANGQRTRFMALGDYANSRGAADMGLLPNRLPGYASIQDDAAREAYGRLWGAKLSGEEGMDLAQMLEATSTGQIKALWVDGSNPAGGLDTRFTERLGKLEFLLVQDMFLTETARLADVVLPVLCAYEKDGTMTNTAGEVQIVRKASEIMGPRSDFDILRFLSHQLARHGVGEPIRLRTPQAAFDEIRQSVPGYDVSWDHLLTGRAEQTHPSFAMNGHAPGVAPAGVVRSAEDSQFTSGSLTPYCTMIRSLREVDGHS
jgi:NADH-quinone oxidoreductase subunit G